MKKVIFAITMLFFGLAQAGNNNNGDTTNNYDQRNYGGNTTNAGGTGYGGNAIAGASSVADAKSNAAAIAAQQQGQAQGQQQTSTSGVKNSGNSSSASGAAVVGSGNSANNNKSSANGNSTSVSVGGDKYEAAASSVIAAPIPTVATSCRLYMFGGATGRDGAVSGSIPLGNDQTCLSGVNMNNMLRVNQQAITLQSSMPFSMDDLVKEACKVEGMDTATVCNK